MGGGGWEDSVRAVCGEVGISRKPLGGFGNLLGMLSDGGHDIMP